jgi:hypothetical protein
MARGWESKSVEDQMASADERKTARHQPAMTAAQREAQVRKDGLLLARAKVLGDLQKARDDRHRAILQQSLEYIDAQIRSNDP